MSTSYLGDGYSGVLLWGAQLEQGPQASGYTVTGSTAAVANNDSPRARAQGGVGPHWQARSAEERDEIVQLFGGKQPYLDAIHELEKQLYQEAA